MAARPTAVTSSATWDGKPVDQWTRAWRVPQVEAHASISSTNDRAAELASGGAPLFTVVVADRQTAGRGRAGRPWSSEQGGLWMSVLMDAPAGAPPPLLLPLRVGLAVAAAVSAAGAEGVCLKWPNDVLVGRRKIAGVLCETVAGSGRIVVGVGVNVAQRHEHFPSALAERATALAWASDRPPTRGDLAGAILEELRGIETEPRLTEVELERIGELDVLRGRRIETAGDLHGTAVRIGADGGLQVRTDGGAVRTIYAGSVRIQQERSR